MQPARQSPFQSEREYAANHWRNGKKLDGAETRRKDMVQRYSREVGRGFGGGWRWDKKKREENLALFVPRVGLEPTRPNGHMALNHACLPISAPGRCMTLQRRCDPAGTRTQDPLIKSEML